MAHTATVAHVSFLSRYFKVSLYRCIFLYIYRQRYNYIITAQARPPVIVIFAEILAISLISHQVSANTSGPRNKTKTYSILLPLQLLLLAMIMMLSKDMQQPPLLSTSQLPVRLTQGWRVTNPYTLLQRRTWFRPCWIGCSGLSRCMEAQSKLARPLVLLGWPRPQRAGPAIRRARQSSPSTTASPSNHTSSSS